MKNAPFVMLFLIAVILVVPPGCGGGSSTKYVPPNLTELEYRLSLPLIQVTQAGNAYLEAKISGTREIQTPINGNCTGAQWSTYQFNLQQGDLIDVTLVSRDGIAPGGNNGKSFIFELTGATTNSQSWPLLMIQGSPASDYLYQDTWRLLTVAHEIGIGNEVGNGGSVMPPFGQTPWQRTYHSGPIGGTYRLTSLNNLVTTVSATVTFTLHRTLPAFCAARPEN